MIQQFDSTKQQTGLNGLVTQSRWYGLRILRASAGATIAWDTYKDQIGAFPGALYESRHGSSGIWITGTVILEYTDDPLERTLPPVSVTGSAQDGAGNLVVVGPDAPGAAATGAPVVGACIDPAGNVQRFKSGSNGQGVPFFTPTTATGTQSVQTVGAAAPLAALQVGGTDGANMRALHVDAAGNLDVVGPDAVGAVPAGNPVMLGVKDQNNHVQYAKADTVGNLFARLVGAGQIDPTAALGAAAPTIAVQIGGTDGANLRALLTDALGRLIGVGRAGAAGQIFKVFAGAIAANGAQVIWTPAAGKKFRLLGAVITSSVATQVNLTDNGGAGVFFEAVLAAGVPLPLNFGPDGFLATTANDVLQVGPIAAATITITVWGVEE